MARRIRDVAAAAGVSGRTSPMMQRDLRGLHVAVVATTDPADPATWSGIPYYMVRGLTEVGAAVTPISVRIKWLLGLMLAPTVIRNGLGSTRYLPDRERLLLRRQAGRLARTLERCRPDVVISPGTLPVSYLATTTPIGIWADATVGGIVDYYPAFSRWSPRTVSNAMTAERDAIGRAAAFIGASEWVVETAEAQVPNAPARRTVIPFGANLDGQPTPTPTPRRPAGAMRLVLVGVDWHRKGADIAMAATQLLRDRGLSVELHIVGCTPPKGALVPEFVHLHRFVDKRSASGRRHLAEIYEQSDVLVLPSRAECFGVVACEAAAYGLPTVASRTGGLTTAVRDGVTGCLVDPAGGAEDYADALEQVLTDSALYARLSAAARERYETELNWPSACRSAVATILE